MKMNKKVSVLLFILTISIIPLLGINNVYATDDFEVGHIGKPGEAGKSTDCSPFGNCYSLGTAGVRITLVSSTGETIDGPIDLWNYGDNVGLSITGGQSVIFDKNKNGKLSRRYDYLNEGFNYNSVKDRILINNDTFNNTSLARIEDVLPNILSGLTREHSGDTYIGYDSNTNTRVPNVTDTLINRIKENTEKATNFGGSTQQRYTYLNNILAALGSSYNASNINGSYFLEFEPLVNWSNSQINRDCEWGSGLPDSYKTCKKVKLFDPNDEADSIKKSWPLLGDGGVVSIGKKGNISTEFSFYGTITEAYLFFESIRNNSNNIYSTFCPDGNCYISNYKADNTPIAFNGTNYGAFKRIVGYGVYIDNVTSIPGTDSKKIFEAATSIDLKNNNDQGYKVVENLKKAYGVSYLSLSDLVKPCSPQVIAYYNSHKGATIEELINFLNSNNVTYPSELKKYTDYGFPTLGDLADYFEYTLSVNNNCPLECNLIAKYELNNNDNKLDVNTFRNKFNVPKNSYYDAADQDIKYKGSNSVSNYCKPLVCDTTDVVKYNIESGDQLRKLFNFFDNAGKTYENLNYDMLIAGGMTDEEARQNASCEPNPYCPSPKAVAHCDGDNSFTLSDTDNIECLSKGFAYNKESELVPGSAKSGTSQSSIDYEYGDNGYCKEEVHFEFPKNVDGIEASNIFKWGVNGKNDTQSALFGKMVVTRDCYIDHTYYDKNNKNEITSKWATVNTGSVDLNNGRINPEIRLIYREAVPNSIYKEDEYLHTGFLKTELSSFSMITIDDDGKESKTLSGDKPTYDYETNTGKSATTQQFAFTCDNLDSDQCVRTYMCVNNCKKIKHVVMEATYNINYGDDFKWYSDKSENYVKKSSSEIGGSNADNANYVLLGYGLPTSFVTHPIKTGEYYGKNLSVNNPKGSMYVIVNQIGTKNNLDGYHFDKYNKFNLEDDDLSNDDESLVYSCGYNVGNKLYCNECSPISAGDDLKVPKGIDVVFRTVELVSDSSDVPLSFPGRSGELKRQRGINWTKMYGIKVTDDVVANILSDKVYTIEEPLYKIKLDTVSIQKIRESNSKAEDAYTQMKDYSFKRETYTATLLQSDSLRNTIATQCTEQKRDNKLCSSAYFAQYIKDNSSSLSDLHDIEYVYAASPFLTELANDSKYGNVLSGACIVKDGTVISTEDRANKYSKTFGC